MINQIRGMLLERGITVPKGRRRIEEALPGILEEANNRLSGALRVLLHESRLEMQYLHKQIEQCDLLIARIAGELEDCRHLVEIPGIGPTIATATIAAIGNGAAFKKGRGFAAWLGVVPGDAPQEACKNLPKPAGMETSICENCSCRERMRCCNVGLGKFLASVPGWNDWWRASELK